MKLENYLTVIDKQSHRSLAVSFEAQMHRRDNVMY